MESSGGHGGVDVSLIVPCEHPHPRRLAELGVDLGVALAGAVLQTVAVAPATRLLHQHLGRLVVDAVGEGLVALPAHLLVEEVLQVASEVFVDRLLGVLLHLVVDGGVDAQPVAVKVIARAVGLPVLVEPSVYGVLPPAEGILGVVLGVLVLGALGLLGVHVAPQHVPEIGGEAGVVVEDLVLELYGYVAEGVPLGLGEVAVPLHLPQDEIPALQGVVGVEDGIVARGLVDHSHQQGGLLHGEVGGLLAEEGL